MCQICIDLTKEKMTWEEARKAAVETLFSDNNLTNEEEMHYYEVINKAVKKIEEDNINKSTD